MINLYDQVPVVYTNTSRDFQYLSWLYNIVLNSVKHNVDALYDLPRVQTDNKLIELLAMTLGFKVRRNYDTKQLIALISIFPTILKYKGTLKSVELIGEALIKASGAPGIITCELNKNILEVTLPETHIDLTLFIDLLPYVLPAGVSCQFFRKTQVKQKSGTKFIYKDIPYADWEKDLSWESDTQTTSGLSGLYSNENNIPNFANYHKIEVKDENTDKVKIEYNLNAGLLDNTIIPIIENSLGDKK